MASELEKLQGRYAEHLVAERLREADHQVSPSNFDKSTVDFIGTRSDGQSYFGQVKFDGRDDYRTSTSLDLQQLQRYLRFAEDGGAPIFLFVVKLKNREIRWADLHKLQQERTILVEGIPTTYPNTWKNKAGQLKKEYHLSSFEKLATITEKHYGRFIDERFLRSFDR